MEKRIIDQEKILTLAHKKYLEACNVLDHRNKAIESLNSDKAKVKAYANKMYLNDLYSRESKLREGDVKYWIEYDLELHEYYLTQEREKLEEAHSEYIKIRRSWMQQKRKYETINNMIVKSKRRIINRMYEKEEEEMQEDKRTNARE
jgi:hypothetical protein